MKTLFLLRHAKSDWSDPTCTDHDRPLNDRGRTAAVKMGQHMAAQNLIPEMIWCSTATRARETFIRWYDEIPATPPVEYRKILYMAGVDRLQSVLSQSEDTHASVMMIGHNPGFHQFAEMMTGSGDMDLQDQLDTKYPTATLAVIELAIDRWRDADFGKGRLVHFITPKSLTS